ncbi:MAG: acyloxyacyl hydrolase [Vicinamibacteraceae bacterium]
MRLVLLVIALLVAQKVAAQPAGASPTVTQRPAAALDLPKDAPAPARDIGPARDGLPDGSSEWSILGVGGRTHPHGVLDDVTGQAPATRLALSAFQWSRVLTAPHGFRPLRGQLQMGFEIVPILHAVRDQASVGFGASPLLLRWRFIGWRHVQPYVEGLSGITRTDHALPEGTTRFNFSSKAGIGTWLAVSEHVGLLVGYRFDHVSNASRRRVNPGLNFHEIYVGLSWIRQPPPN